MKTTIVFDWGNTLMEVFPDYVGPVQSWQTVKTAPGARQVLEVLALQYNLVIATNASDSNSTQVWQALERAKLAKPICAIFFSSELGFWKPDPLFFTTIMEKLAACPENMVMVSDDAENDCWGAHTVGWKSIWFNRSGKPCKNLKPWHDQEIFSLSVLPRALKQSPIPSIETCLLWLHEQGAEDRLFSHSWRVAATAYDLVVRLAIRGIALDPILAHRGGLLHDLAKLSMSPAEDHGAEAARLLHKHNQPALAKIAQLHMTSQMNDTFLISGSWEEKIVHIADKYCEGGELVSVEERLAALEARYPDAGSLFQKAHPGLLKLQKEICRILKIESTELIPILKNDAFEI